ncbi:MAG: hypothetical protein P4L44_09240 [Oryzomonas sp.]|uniref:hypothetical protein n=1 Tax=Oryzomonas sp. TaxID=2855186 RepID=UPI002850F2D0|nr:hypothetical protein [Oryzomonas sp.]MDR3580133.1 hypothetical protein [Oryzomonas sp.]
MNRYIVIKGWEGFCDRLQCLSEAIVMSQRFNRILFVDWEDRIWSHDRSGFYRYFNLVDLPYVTSAERIPNNIDVFPPFWRRGLGMPADEWVHKLKEELVFDALEGRHFEPVWVHPGVGFRTYDFGELVKHLRLSFETLEEVKPLLDKAPLDLPVVHLRGTDRAVSEERWSLLRTAAPVACVISDDAALARRWSNESPDSVVLSDTLIEGSTGGHKLDPNAIKQFGLTKHQMNIRLLADFMVLARARDAYALNEESVFFIMARLFGACGGVAAVLQPSPAAVILPTCRDGFSFEYRGRL